MSHHPTLPHALTLNAVIEPGLIHHDGCQQVRLVHEHGFLDALTWESMSQVPAGCLRKAVSHLIPVGKVEHGLHVVTRFDWCHTIDPLSLVPRSFGSTDDVVARCREIVDAVATPPLRGFLSDVFNTPDVFYRYWDTPSEQDAAPGGLALAAVSLAEAVRDTRGVSVDERDLAITFALMNHVGHVWWLREGWSDGYEILQPELAALRHLYGPFDELTFRAPALAAALRELMLDQRSPARDAAAQAVKKLIARVEARQAVMVELEQVQRYRREETSKATSQGGNVIEFPHLPTWAPIPDEHLW